MAIWIQQNESRHLWLAAEANGEEAIIWEIVWATRKSFISSEVYETALAASFSFPFESLVMSGYSPYDCIADKHSSNQISQSGLFPIEYTRLIYILVF